LVVGLGCFDLVRVGRKKERAAVIEEEGDLPLTRAVVEGDAAEGGEVEGVEAEELIFAEGGGGREGGRGGEKGNCVEDMASSRWIGKEKYALGQE